ncbi:MAG: hypothetical protein NVS9B15_13800 [Acidobacteriaceae bacterium]
MSGIGRLLIGAGLLLILVGGLFIFAERLGVPIGRLPGDFSHQGKNVRVYFPLGTSLLLSALLSLIVWLLSKWRR